MAERVPVEELVDLDELRARHGDALSPRHVRAALPRGWALDDDGRHAHRDVRLLFREGWILALGLVVFGAVGGALVVGGLPRGWDGYLRLGVSLVVLLVLGGIVGPLVTRALKRR